ncbi:unnamed protein product [Pedinophyceae sp. YPF-701]|nr:unnamed protein product [Pedinophyceae sp. YPF-701]
MWGSNWVGGQGGFADLTAQLKGRMESAGFKEQLDKAQTGLSKFAKAADNVLFEDVASEDGSESEEDLAGIGAEAVAAVSGWFGGAKQAEKPAEQKPAQHDDGWSDDGWGVPETSAPQQATSASQAPTSRENGSAGPARCADAPAATTPVAADRTGANARRSTGAAPARTDSTGAPIMGVIEAVRTGKAGSREPDSISPTASSAVAPGAARSAIRALSATPPEPARRSSSDDDGEAAALRQELSGAWAALDRVRADLRTATTQRAAAEAQVREARDAADAARARGNELQRRVDTLELQATMAAGAEERLAAEQATTARLRAKVEELQGELRQGSGGGSGAEGAGPGRSAAEFEALRGELEEARAEAERRRGEVLALREGQQAQGAMVSRRLKEAQERAADLEAEAAAHRRDADELRSECARLRTQAQDAAEARAAAERTAEAEATRVRDLEGVVRGLEARLAAGADELHAQLERTRAEVAAEVGREERRSGYAEGQQVAEATVRRLREELTGATARAEEAEAARREAEDALAEARASTAGASVLQGRLTAALEEAATLRAAKEELEWEASQHQRREKELERQGADKQKKFAHVQATFQERVAALTARVDELEAELREARDGATAAKRRTAALQASIDDAMQERDALAQRLEQANAACKELQGRVAALQEREGALEGAVAAMKADLEAERDARAAAEAAAEQHAANARDAVASALRDDATQWSERVSAAEAAQSSLQAEVEELRARCAAAEEAKIALTMRMAELADRRGVDVGPEGVHVPEGGPGHDDGAEPGGAGHATHSSAQALAAAEARAADAERRERELAWQVKALSGGDAGAQEGAGNSGGGGWVGSATAAAGWVGGTVGSVAGALNPLGWRR